jgi:hypothetical protein
MPKFGAEQEEAIAAQLPTPWLILQFGRHLGVIELRGKVMRGNGFTFIGAIYYNIDNHFLKKIVYN